MTNENTATTAPEDQAQQTPISSIAPLTEDEVNHRFVGFAQQYNVLIALLNNLTFNPKLREMILSHFDTGYLWTKEGFAGLANQARVFEEFKKQQQEKKDAIEKEVLKQINEFSKNSPPIYGEIENPVEKVYAPLHTPDAV